MYANRLPEDYSHEKPITVYFSELQEIYDKICCQAVAVVIAALTLKAPITTAADDSFCNIFPNFRKK